MTILVDARPLAEPSPGGVTRVAAGLLPALMRAMPEQKFVLATTGQARPILPIAASNAVHRHRFYPNKLWSLLAFLRAVSFEQAFQKEKPDLLLLSNLGFVGRTRLPYLLVVHDLSFLIEPKWFSLKSRFWHRAVRAKTLIREASHLFAVSKTTRDDLGRLLRIPPEKITVLTLGVEESVSPAELPDPLKHKRIVLALGGTDPRKNAGCAVEAVKNLCQNPQFKDLHLVIVGAQFIAPPRDRVTPEPEDVMNHAPTIIHLKHPTDQALASLMKHASAFLYPSWYEGFGLPLHEAARFGTPCIASTAGALPETAPQGTIFVPPSKPHLWSTALEMVLTQPEKYKTETHRKNWTETAEQVRTVIEKMR